MTTDPRSAGTAGLRRSSPCVRRAEALAERFAGLPPGITRWRLAAALRTAAKPLGLTEPMLRLAEHYIDLSWDADWEAGSEPVITTPLIEIADHLGKGERQVRNIERALAERGLLAWRDSGNHHRRGRRDRNTGRLVYAYGPSLGPLGTRAAEIIALAQRHRAALAEARRLRIAVAALRRSIRANAEAAAQAGLTVPADLAATGAAPRAGLSVEALATLRDGLAAQREALRRLFAERPEGAMAEITAQPAIPRAVPSDTGIRHTMNGYGTAAEKRDAPQAGPTARGCQATGRADGGAALVPLGLALAAMPGALRAQLAGPGWPGLTETLHARLTLHGIGQDEWAEACLTLGRAGATLCLVVLEGAAGRPGNAVQAPLRRPAAYFRALVDRGRTRRLHLDRSIRALARHAQAGGMPCSV